MVTGSDPNRDAFERVKWKTLARTFSPGFGNFQAKESSFRITVFFAVFVYHQHVAARLRFLIGNDSPKFAEFE